MIEVMKRLSKHQEASTQAQKGRFRNIGVSPRPPANHRNTGMELILSPHDNVMPRRYSCAVFLFPRHQFASPDIVGSLRLGLQRLFHKLPALSATLRQLNGTTQKGRLKLGGPWHSASDVLAERDLTMSNELDYETLKGQRFPMDKLDALVLLSELVVRYHSNSLEKPVMGAQVNFVRGGLILAVLYHHSVMDGLANVSVTKLWASLCHEDLPDTSTSDYSTGRDTVMSSVIPGVLRDFEQYEVRASGLKGIPLQPLSKDVLANSFFIPIARVHELKRRVEDHILQHPECKRSPFISTNDVFSAWLFQCVVQARLASASETSSRPSQAFPFSMTISGREAMSPMIPREFVGNLSTETFFRVSADIASSGKVCALADIAQQIRNKILKVRGQFEGLTTALNGVNDLSEVVPTSRFAEPYPFTLIPFHAYDYYKIDWGPTVGGVCERMKLPVVPTDYTQYMDGMINTLTELQDQEDPADNGLEFVITLERHAMAHFREHLAGVGIRCAKDFLTCSL